MKRLLLIAALVAAPAMADSWAIRNKAGGEIVMTDRKCPAEPRLLRSYYYGSDGQVREGCWTVVDDQVRVVWQDGTEYVYPLNAFYKKSTDKKGTSL
jgi:hypothetical protein